MGNNKGRSNGCVTCLRRRVKCDQCRPICTRCSNGKFICLGYRETLFIDAREQVLRRLDRISASQLAKKASYSETAGKCQTSLLLTEKAVRPQDMLRRCQASQICLSLSNSTTRDSQFVSHLVANFDGPMGVICRNLIAPSYQADSLQQTAMKQSFLALATTFYGLGHAQESLMYDGRHLYLRALKTVNTIMSDSSITGSIEILSSVVALCLHEAIAPTRSNDHSWLRHIDGLEQLFAIQGTMSKKSDPVNRALLEVTRPMMIAAALHARRPSLMACPKWSATTVCMLNNSHQPSTDSALTYLWDALALIPALYHERDSFVTGSTKISTKATDSEGSLYPSAIVWPLLDRSLRLRDDVRLQMAQWKASHPDSDFPSIPCIAIPSRRPYPCAVVTHFSSLQMANVFTLYNALVILINQLIFSIYSLFPICDVDITANESALEQISSAAMDIVKSIDYHFPFTESSATSIAGASGPRNFHLLFPMRVAHQVLSLSESPQDIAKTMWLEDVFYIIKGRAGPWMSNDHIFGAAKPNRRQAEKI